MASDISVVIAVHKNLEADPKPYCQYKKIDLGVYFEGRIPGVQGTQCIPILGVETKEYADKTMLAAIEGPANKLKKYFPWCLYLGLDQDNALGDNESKELQCDDLTGRIFHLRRGQKRKSTREGVGLPLSLESVEEFLDAIENHLKFITDAKEFPMNMRDHKRYQDQVQYKMSFRQVFEK